MTFEEMKDCLETYRRDLEFFDRINEIIPCCDIWDVVKSHDRLLRVVSDAFEDESDWIGYFIFELDFGRKYVPGMISGKDGEDIRLSTYEDLYTLLTEEKNNDP